MSRRWFFGFFFISGLCSVLYEIVWLRLAMSQFGVTTAYGLDRALHVHGRPRNRIMAGRQFIRRHSSRSLFTALRLYALAEI